MRNVLCAAASTSKNIEIHTHTYKYTFTQKADNFFAPETSHISRISQFSLKWMIQIHKLTSSRWNLWRTRNGEATLSVCTPPKKLWATSIDGSVDDKQPQWCQDEMLEDLASAMQCCKDDLPTRWCLNDRGCFLSISMDNLDGAFDIGPRCKSFDTKVQWTYGGPSHCQLPMFGWSDFRLVGVAFPGKKNLALPGKAAPISSGFNDLAHFKDVSFSLGIPWGFTLQNVCQLWQVLRV